MVDLVRMRKLMDRLPVAQFKLDKAMAQATRTTTVLTGMPHGSGEQDRMADKVSLVTIARDRRDAIARELQQMRDELQPVIDALEDPLQRSAMRLRYINGMTVREIAYSLTYSEQHLFRVLQQAERIVSKRDDK